MSFVPQASSVANLENILNEFKCESDNLFQKVKERNEQFGLELEETGLLDDSVYERFFRILTVLRMYETIIVEKSKRENIEICVFGRFPETETMTTHWIQQHIGTMFNGNDVSVWVAPIEWWRTLQQTTEQQAARNETDSNKLRKMLCSDIFVFCLSGTESEYELLRTPSGGPFSHNVFVIIGSPWQASDGEDRETLVNRTAAVAETFLQHECGIGVIEARKRVCCLQFQDVMKQWCSNHRTASIRFTTDPIDCKFASFLEHFAQFVTTLSVEGRAEQYGVEQRQLCYEVNRIKIFLRKEMKHIGLQDKVEYCGVMAQLVKKFNANLVVLVNNERSSLDMSCEVCLENYSCCRCETDLRRYYNHCANVLAKLNVLCGNLLQAAKMEIQFGSRLCFRNGVKVGTALVKTIEEFSKSTTVIASTGYLFSICVTEPIINLLKVDDVIYTSYDDVTNGNCAYCHFSDIMRFTTGTTNKRDKNRLKKIIQISKKIKNHYGNEANESIKVSLEMPRNIGRDLTFVNEKCNDNKLVTTYDNETDDWPEYMTINEVSEKEINEKEMFGNNRTTSTNDGKTERNKNLSTCVDEYCNNCHSENDSLSPENHKCCLLQNKLYLCHKAAEDKCVMDQRNFIQINESMKGREHDVKSWCFKPIDDNCKSENLYRCYNESVFEAVHFSKEVLESHKRRKHEFQNCVLQVYSKTINSLLQISSHYKIDALFEDKALIYSTFEKKIEEAFDQWNVE